MRRSRSISAQMLVFSACSALLCAFVLAVALELPTRRMQRLCCAAVGPIIDAAHLRKRHAQSLFYPASIAMPSRVALITGSSRGIGRAIALRLAHDGAIVAVNYRERRDQADEVVQAITKAGGRAAAIGADLAIESDCTRLVDTVRETLGPIDIVVNNAGVFRKGDLADFNGGDMEHMQSINVDGLIYVTRAAVNDMKARGWGRIVNVASIA